MPLQIGSTFVNQQYRNLPPHLWVVLSDPSYDSEKVVIVNISTWRDIAVGLNDDSCVVNDGDHPGIDHRSYVYYRDSRCTTLEVLNNGLNGVVLEQREDCSDDLLNRILDGAAMSIFTPNEVLGVLQGQELID